MNKENNAEEAVEETSKASNNNPQGATDNSSNGENEFKDKYLRSLAELENLKKYNQKQVSETANYAISKFAKELLTVVDILDKALSATNKESIDNKDFKSFLEGIELTHKTFHKILKQFGITEISKEIIGQEFNPEFQEAVVSQPNKDKPNNTIFEVFESGFIINDKLLRPAKVGIVQN